MTDTADELSDVACYRDRLRCALDLHARGVSLVEACEIESVDLRRAMRFRRSHRPGYLPLPAEIESATARIRATWSAEEFEFRLAGHGRDRLRGSVGVVGTLIPQCFPDGDGWNSIG